MIFLKFICFFALLGILHTYVFYPLIVKALSVGKKPNNNCWLKDENNLPLVYILIAAYNEEKVIGKKIESILSSDYPEEKLKIIVGSDGSTDQTNSIVEQYVNQDNRIQLIDFGGRNGKANILNKITRQLKSEESQQSVDAVYIFTDANIIFNPITVFQLARHFKNREIGLVAARIINKVDSKTMISATESFYIHRENEIKYHETLSFGSMMGAFGACYAIRAELAAIFPSNILMEDFYQTMQLIDQGYQAIKEPDAIAYEDLIDDIESEFIRKRRISAGNYQNLAYFKHMLWNKPRSIAFAFFSHKVLRWIGPMLYIMAFLSALIVGLSQPSVFYWFLAIAMLLLALIPIVLLKLNLPIKKISPFKQIIYFIYMNLALFLGFIMYIKGINTNVWKPTQRNIEPHKN